MDTITLKISCEDKKGLIASVSTFVFSHAGNIVNLDQYTDPDKKMFFMRIEWEKEGFKIKKDDLSKKTKEFFFENKINGSWELFHSDINPRMAIFVSKYDHCLYDLLLRCKSGELKCEIPLIISNHNDLTYIAKYFNIDFVYVPVKKEDRVEAEDKELKLLNKYKIDFIVLARYMQILSSKIVSMFPNKIINIHHSFLPAFKGAKPYHQAYEKGVKIIGASSHFVTEELDQGPIIQQDVIHVSHKDKIKDLIIKGRDIERRVLAESVKLYIQNRIFSCGNRTIIL